MSQILCSTGAIIGRSNGRNFYLLEDLSKQLSCDGFELMMYSDWYERCDELIEFIRGCRLNIPVMHCQKSVGELISIGEELPEAYRRFTINCKIAEAVGAQKLVMHLWDGHTSDRFISNNLNAYPELTKIAETHGITLLVENVVCNQKDPLTHWNELLKLYPDVRFVFDTKMAAFHNQLDALYAPENMHMLSGSASKTTYDPQNANISHFHVNDYAGGYMDWANLRTLAIGEGHIDFDRFFEFIKSIGYDGTFTCESTELQSDGTVRTDILNTQFEYIRRELNSRIE